MPVDIEARLGLPSLRKGGRFWLPARFLSFADLHDILAAIVSGRHRCFVLQAAAAQERLNR
jgi:hypothetical protein